MKRLMKFNLIIGFNITKDKEIIIKNSIWDKYINDVFDKSLEIIENNKTDHESFLESDMWMKPRCIYLNYISDEEIRELNKKWRNIDKSTDCLSFPYESEHWNETFWDIFIAFPYIGNQANKYWVGLKSEITKMLIHSLLHLFWFNHDKDDAYKEMNALEEMIFKRIEN